MPGLINIYGCAINLICPGFLWLHFAEGTWKMEPSKDRGQIHVETLCILAVSLCANNCILWVHTSNLTEFQFVCNVLELFSDGAPDCRFRRSNSSMHY